MLIVGIGRCLRKIPEVAHDLSLSLSLSFFDGTVCLRCYSLLMPDVNSLVTTRNAFRLRGDLEIWKRLTLHNEDFGRIGPLGLIILLLFWESLDSWLHPGFILDTPTTSLASITMSRRRR